MKSLFRSPLFTTVMGFVLWAWMSFVAHTIRWRVEGNEAARAVLGGREPGVILACWHETVLLMPSGWLRFVRHWPEHTMRTAMMVSLSPDGAAISAAVERLDLDVVRGSASNKKKSNKDKGGVRAIAEASKRLREGGVVCMTPDGPRGPRRLASAGAIMLAQRTGAAIVPYAISSKPAPRFDSWDTLIFPLPFSRGGVVFGAPIDCPREATAEALQEALQTGMDKATRRAEELAGFHARPDPAGAAV
ncbi:lysophospholipid acyltransferase family protein [Hyphomonas sp.]|uniref:lysophospholipid acyltransferase family protein n=1 Tax=Hyphomonas sp. TaxID=87 RepID=UPI00391D9F26